MANVTIDWVCRRKQKSQTAVLSQERPLARRFAKRQERSFTERQKDDIQPCRVSLGTSAFRSDAFGRFRLIIDVGRLPLGTRRPT